MFVDLEVDWGNGESNAGGTMDNSSTHGWISGYPLDVYEGGYPCVILLNQQGLENNHNCSESHQYLCMKLQ